MKIHILSLAAASMAFLPSNALSAISTLTTVRTYDSATNANSVDASGATSGILVGVFSTNVGTAYDNNLGGVITFDDAGAATLTGSTFDVTYGLSGAQTLTISQSTINYYIDTPAAIGGVPISGANVMRSGGSQNQSYAFSTSLQSLGFTIIARNAARTGSIVLTYSDNSTATFALSVATATGSGSSITPDTFYGFNAPVGLGISKLDITPNGYLAIDDLAFIIPEPSSGALTLAALASTCFRRRRR